MILQALIDEAQRLAGFKPRLPFPEWRERLPRWSRSLDQRPPWRMFYNEGMSPAEAWEAWNVLRGGWHEGVAGTSRSNPAAYQRWLKARRKAERHPPENRSTAY